MSELSGPEPLAWDSVSDPAGDGETVVVIDDTTEILDLLAMFLSEEGFRAVACADAGVALDVVAAEQPALVIVDLRMAGVLGWGLIDALVADPRTGETPFLVCSGAVGELHAALNQIRQRRGEILEKP